MRGLIVVLGFLSTLAGAAGVDFDNSKVGARLSSIDLDASVFDDTIGFGIFSEAPYNSHVKLGLGMDFWRTDNRFTSKDDITDIAFGGYGKYYFLSHLKEMAPYGLAGLAMHFIQQSAPGVSTVNEQELSLDLGVGVDMAMTRYIALNGEIKLRNVDEFDYMDVAVGAIAKF